MTTSFITMSVERPKGAPFSAFASDSDGKLIPDKPIDDMKELTWESMIVKNYCIAVNQQKSIEIKKLPNLPLIQKVSRGTADLWLNKLAISVNEVYSEASYFTDSFDGYYDKLIALAKDLENKSNKELFLGSLKDLQDDINSIRAKVESLNRGLKDFRPRLDGDIRNFKGLVEEAKKIYKADEFTVNKLNEEIEALKAEISSLNKKIAATATMGTLSLLGVIGIIVGVVLAVPTAGTSIPLVGASVGVVAAGSGASYALLGVYNSQLKAKKSEYASKSQELQEVQEEMAAAMMVQKQYDPLIKSGGKAVEVVQKLLEGWEEIFSNFSRFMDEIVKLKNADPNKIQRHLDTSKTAVTNIKEVIEKHKKAGVISIYSERDIAEALAPHHMRMNNSANLVLPLRLHLAYVRRMQVRQAG